MPLQPSSAGQELSKKLKKKLEQLSRGELAEGARLDLLAADVLQNPKALEYLANLAKRRQDKDEV